MVFSKSILILFLVGLVMIGFVSAVEYYVDYESGSDFNNGLTTSAPFKHAPGDISAQGVAASTSLQPGDVVIFKGGVAYKSGLSIDWSGSPENDIVFLGESNWGSGKAIFDMENNRDLAFGGSGSYLTFQGFVVTRWQKLDRQSNSPMRPSGSAKYWTIKDNSFEYMQDWDDHNTYDHSKALMWLPGGVSYFFIDNNEFVGIGRRGIIARNVDHVYITNNDFGGSNRAPSTTGWFSSAITIAPLYGLASNIVIKDNVFHDGWQYGGDSNPELHHSPNWVHFYGKSTSNITNITIEGNYFYNDKQFTYGTGSGMISIASYTNNFEIKNNVFVNAVAWSGWMLEMGGHEPDAADNINVHSNTFVIRKYLNPGSINAAIIIYPGATDSSKIKNNLFFSDDDEGWLALRTTGTGSSEFAGDIDYNSYYSDRESFINFGSSFSWPEWQSSSLAMSRGFDQNSFWNSAGSDVFIVFPESPAFSSSGNYRPKAVLSDGSPNPICTGGEEEGYIGAFPCEGEFFHPADLNQNGCIDLNEISAYVALWLNGEVDLQEVSDAVVLWLSGTGCS